MKERERETEREREGEREIVESITSLHSMLLSARFQRAVSFRISLTNFLLFCFFLLKVWVSTLTHVVCGFVSIH